MEIFVIPYTLLCCFSFYGVKLVTGGDKVVASYSLAWLVNVTYLSVIGWGVMMQLVFGYTFDDLFVCSQHILSLLIGYYTFDTVRFMYVKEKDAAVYVTHHCFALLLMMLHVWEILPLHIGCVFVSLFELSNVVLIPYQLCLHKGWREVRYKLSHPMVFTYVPLRLIAIPLSSLLYLPYMRDMSTCMWYFCASMIGSLVVFSVYFAIYIGYRYALWLLKNKISE
jgi:hypothetical protein